jgi:thiol-disulfide isomerase/thioredoxin
MAAHVMLGKMTGLSTETLKQIRSGQPSANANHHALVRFVPTLQQTSGTIPAQEFVAIKAAGYTDTRLVEITLAIALTIFTNTFNRINDADVDSSPATDRRIRQVQRLAARAVSFRYDPLTVLPRSSLMNIGPLAIPVAPLILFLGVIAAVLTCRCFSATQKETESAIYACAVIALIVARISFVLHYLPGYGGSLLKMLDFRDAGFDAAPGVIAGIAAVVFVAIRRASIRRPLTVAATIGLIVWSAAGATVRHLQRPMQVPAVSLFDAAGERHVLAPHNSKPLVVNLWATWCSPCRAEMPVLASEQTKHRELDVVLVNQGESPATVEAFMAELNVHVENSRFDPDLALAKATKTTAYPTTLFYDASGRLLEKHLGRFSEATFQETIARLYPNLAAK